VVTGALLSAALAVLLWPGRAGVRRRRLASIVGGARTGTGWRPSLDRPVGTAVAAGGLAALTSTPLVAGLAAVAALVLVRHRQAGRADRRSEQDVRAVADGLAVLAAELRSGRSLAAAGEAAAATGTGGEAGRALVSAVRAPGTAGLRHRDPGVHAALARVSAGASLSARTGCSLATVLTAVEDDLRARARHRLELRAATAGPRAGAAVLAGLPLLGLAMGSGVGADPWRVLTTTPAGQMLLVLGVCLELAGLEWSRRLIQRALR
jgi:tight adherence protein B